MRRLKEKPSEHFRNCAMRARLLAERPENHGTVDVYKRIAHALDLEADDLERSAVLLAKGKQGLGHAAATTRRNRRPALSIARDTIRSNPRAVGFALTIPASCGFLCANRSRYGPTT